MVRQPKSVFIAAVDCSILFILIVCLAFVSVADSVNVNGVEIVKQESQDNMQQPPPLQQQLLEVVESEIDDQGGSNGGGGGGGGASIVSESRNLTVYSNETVHLPCVVRNASPQTMVIWNQCEDAACVHLRSPLTINRDNFIEDLRFRVLADTWTFMRSSSNDSSTSSSGETVTRAAPADPSYNLVEQLPPVNSEAGLLAWNLEIRKFGKLDEACYQCQLNSFRVKTIYYCLKLQTRVTARPRKLTVRLNQPIRLKCMTDENVRLSNIKWFRNGHRIVDEAPPAAAGTVASSNAPLPNLSPTDLTIEKKVHNDHIYSSLHIRHATLDDAGTYVCKFGHLSDKIHVDVVVAGSGGADERVKSAEIRSNNQEDESADVVPSISQSISDAMFSSSSSSSIIIIEPFSLSSLFYLLVVCKFAILRAFSLL